MEPIDQSKYAEATTVGLKILGFILAVLTFRWMVSIFKGDDDKFSSDEFKKMVAVILFVGLAIYMIYKEGERADLTHQVYGEFYLAIVFGALLTVLHLESALEMVLKIVQAARGGTVTTVANSTSETVTQQQTITNETPTQGS